MNAHRCREHEVCLSADNPENNKRELIFTLFMGIHPKVKPVGCNQKGFGASEKGQRPFHMVWVRFKMSQAYNLFQRRWC